MEWLLLYSVVTEPIEQDSIVLQSFCPRRRENIPPHLTTLQGNFAQESVLLNELLFAPFLTRNDDHKLFLLSYSISPNHLMVEKFEGSTRACHRPRLLWAQPLYPKHDATQKLN